MALLKQLPETEGLSEGLSKRAAEILRLLAEGMSDREIAERLVVEVGTVKNHVHRILEKLNVSSRQEAASYLAFIKK